MYARTLDGRKITLGVSGKLLDRTVIIFDRETKTEWSQLTAKGLKGKLTGKHLKRLPVVHSTWKVWRQMHPETEVLQPVYPLARYRGAARRYGGYFAARKASKLLGLIERGGAKSWPFARLRKERLVQEKALGRELVIVTDAKSDTAVIFEARLGGRLLHFDAQPGSELRLKDRETGSLWNGLTGKALSGELAGKSLVLVPSTHAYPAQWKAYFPKEGARPTSRPTSRPAKKRRYF